MTLSESLEKLKDIPQHELAYHLGLYKTYPYGNFAVIKLSGSVINNPDSLERIADNLSILQGLGLNPIITYGWGQKLTDLLKANGVETKFQNGVRITDDTVMLHLRGVDRNSMISLEYALRKKAVNYADFLPAERLITAVQDMQLAKIGGTENGKIKSINVTPLLTLANKGVIPILSPLGRGHNGNEYNLNSAEVLVHLAQEVNTHKVIMVTNTKGILDKDGNVIKQIVLQRDYEPLIKWVVSEGAEKNLKEAKDYLCGRNDGVDHSVQIVGPDNLCKELFTHKGDGTFIRKGYAINKATDEFIKSGKAKTIIEDAWGKHLVDGFFESIGPKSTMYVEEQQKGLAIVEDTTMGLYLSILAVKSGCQKTGVGSDLMHAIDSTDKGKLFLRTKADNPIKEYYGSIFEGKQEITVKGVPFVGFWQGFSFGEIPAILKYMQNKPLNFKY